MAAEVKHMLSENIKRLRAESGMSQEELAARLAVVRQTVSKWERGMSVPDADMVVRLAELFGVLLRDNQQAHRLEADGRYVRVRDDGPPLNSQAYFCRRAVQAAQEAARQREEAPDAL